MISNLVVPSLELFLINDTEDTKSRPFVDHIRSLCLPALSRDAAIVSMLARADPNCSDITTTSTGLNHPESFRVPKRRQATAHGIRSIPERAIVLFHLILTLFGRVNAPNFHEFSFVIHRHSLLELAFSEDLNTFDPVPWEAWGPPVTSWDEMPHENPYITASAGQRHVLFGNGTLDHIIVRDYNIFTVRRMLAMPPLLHGSNSRVVVHERSINISALFMQCIRHSLPYVEICSERKYSFDGVMMDDDRIICFRVSHRVISVSLSLYNFSKGIFRSR